MGRGRLSVGFPHQMLQDHLVEGLVIAVGDELLGLLFVEGPRLLDQKLERPAAVVQMREPVLDLGGAEGMDVEADVFAVLAVTVALQGADLVEGNAQVGAEWSCRCMACRPASRQAQAAGRPLRRSRPDVLIRKLLPSPVRLGV